MLRVITLVISMLVFSQSTLAESKILANSGVAISGYDAVAYHVQGKAIKGDAEYTYTWNGADWHFSNRNNLDKFANSPETYAPQYGGYCAFAVAKGALAPIDPHAWTIHNGKLYLNYSQSVSDKWQRNIDSFIATANENWPRLNK